MPYDDPRAESEDVVVRAKYWAELYLSFAGNHMNMMDKGPLTSRVQRAVLFAREMRKCADVVGEMLAGTWVVDPQLNRISDLEAREVERSAECSRVIEAYQVDQARIVAAEDECGKLRAKVAVLEAEVARLRARLPCGNVDCKSTKTKIGPV